VAEEEAAAVSEEGEEGEEGEEDAAVVEVVVRSLSRPRKV
jgi:hypothetical protein